MSLYRGAGLSKAKKDWKSWLSPSLQALDKAWSKRAKRSLLMLAGIGSLIAAFKLIMDADIETPTVATPISATSDISKLTQGSRPVEEVPKPTLAQKAKSFITQKPIAHGTTTAEQVSTFKYSADVQTAILEASKATGVDAGLLASFIHIESKGDPKARSGSFVGLGQLGKPAWEDVSKKVTLPSITKDYDPRLDAKLNALATATLIQLNSEYLQKNGITPTVALLYTAHNLGASRAVKVAKGQFDQATVEAISGKTVKGKTVGGQAQELKQGGHTQYLANVEASLAKRMPTATASASPPTPVAHAPAPVANAPMQTATASQPAKSTPAPQTPSAPAQANAKNRTLKVAEADGATGTYRPANTETRTTEYVQTKSGALLAIPT